MLEKLFGKASDVVHHTIAPYVVERQQFLEHCYRQGYQKSYLKKIAGILLTAASELHAQGSLDVDRVRLEAAAARIEAIRSAAGFGQGASFYRGSGMSQSTPPISTPRSISR